MRVQWSANNSRGRGYGNRNAPSRNFNSRNTNFIPPRRNIPQIATEKSEEAVYQKLAEIFSKILKDQTNLRVTAVLEKFRLFTGCSLDHYVKSRGIRQEVIDVLRKVKTVQVHYESGGGNLVSPVEVDSEDEETKERVRRGVYAGYRTDLNIACNPPGPVVVAQPSIFSENFVVEQSAKLSLEVPMKVEFDDYFRFELFLAGRNIAVAGMEKMTPVQQKAMPFLNLLVNRRDADVFIRAPAKRGVTVALVMMAILQLEKGGGRSTVVVVTGSHEAAEKFHNTFLDLADCLPFTCYLSNGQAQRLIINEVYVGDIDNYKRDKDAGVLTTNDVRCLVFKDIETIPPGFDDVTTIDTCSEDHFRIFSTKNARNRTMQSILNNFFRNNGKIVSILPDEFS